MKKLALFLDSKVANLHELMGGGGEISYETSYDSCGNDFDCQATTTYSSAGEA